MGTVQPKVSATIPGHGVFVSTPAALDIVIARYLPASVERLRQVVTDIEPAIDYSDLHDVSAFLLILADQEQGRLDNDAAARELVDRARASAHRRVSA